MVISDGRDYPISSTQFSQTTGAALRTYYTRYYSCTVRLETDDRVHDHGLAMLSFIYHAFGYTRTTITESESITMMVARPS